MGKCLLTHLSCVVPCATLIIRHTVHGLTYSSRRMQWSDSEQKKNKIAKRIKRKTAATAAGGNNQNSNMCVECAICILDVRPYNHHVAHSSQLRARSVQFAQHTNAHSKGETQINLFNAFAVDAIDFSTL